LGESGFFSELIGDFARYLSPKKGKAPLYLLIGLLFGIGILVLFLAALLLLGVYTYVGMAEGAAYILPLLAFFLVQGSAEELLCRGGLMPVLSSCFGGTAAAVGSALVFSLMHAMNSGVSFFAFLNIFLFGLFFASVTQRTESVFPACGLHAGWNFAQSLLGLPVSGNASPYALFCFEGRVSLWSGGAFGPEASPILTPLLLALLAVTFCYGKKKINR
jgi:membrane protease YdiL (CAAX protease family)